MVSLSTSVSQSPLSRSPHYLTSKLWLETMMTVATELLLYSTRTLWCLPEETAYCVLIDVHVVVPKQCLTLPTDAPIKPNCSLLQLKTADNNAINWQTTFGTRWTWRQQHYYDITQLYLPAASQYLTTHTVTFRATAISVRTPDWHVQGRRLDVTSTSLLNW